MMRTHLYFKLANILFGDRSDWKNHPKEMGGNSIWFHAASAGELEILMPLIEAAVKNGRKACVSIFSPSAENGLKKLPPELIYAGFSPGENEWLEALRHYGVSEVVTSKYEAWPGLWRAASIANIRITIVCAQMRSSLLWAKRILKFLGVALPKLRFFTLEEGSAFRLKQYFPKAECIGSADPRWLRVIQRAESSDKHELFQKWRTAFAHTRKPYWVIGSAWAEDMKILAPLIKTYPGTVWVVPHSLKEKPSREIFAPFPNCVLVDEMGLLVELYSIAERAWVGGGFGEGIHSTLEPAVYSIPVACGPNEVEKFFEAKELMAQGVLTVCRSTVEAQHWLKNTSAKSGFSLKLKMEMIHQMIGSICK